MKRSRIMLALLAVAACATAGPAQTSTKSATKSTSKCPPVTPKNDQEKMMIEGSSAHQGCWVRDKQTGQLVFVSAKGPNSSYKSPRDQYNRILKNEQAIPDTSAETSFATFNDFELKAANADNCCIWTDAATAERVLQAAKHLLKAGQGVHIGEKAIDDVSLRERFKLTGTVDILDNGQHYVQLADEKEKDLFLLDATHLCFGDGDCSAQDERYRCPVVLSRTGPDVYTADCDAVSSHVRVNLRKEGGRLEGEIVTDQNTRVYKFKGDRINLSLEPIFHK